MSYEVIFKHDEALVLTLNNLLNRTSAVDAIKRQRDNGLSFETADIFESRGRLRYLVNRMKFHK